MNFLKQTMKIFALALLLSVTSCQDKYPELEDGLYAEFVTTEGTMVAKLYHDKMPVTVANFVALAEGTHPNVSDSLKGRRYYNGITFHRVMNKFMIQGGDPAANGTGGPGYTFNDEFHPDLSHDKPGILSMANYGANTNGSQFFITEVPKKALDPFDAQGNLKNCDNPRVSCHGVFGEIVLGMEVQDSISNVAVSREQNALNKPLTDVVINELNIIRKGTDAQAFDAVKVYTEGLPLLPEKMQALKDEAQAKMKEAAKEAAGNFLKKNANREGTVIEFPTGLIMIKTEAKNGVKPTSEQKALIDCAGYFENGKLFYTTWKDVATANGLYNEQADKQGAYKPFPMIYNETAGLVPGFREAMLNMNIGDKAHVFIPSHLGYGANGYGPVPPNTNIVFDIEIAGIQK